MEASFLTSLIPIFTTLIYMSNDPSFTVQKALLYILPSCLAILSNFSFPSLSSIQSRCFRPFTNKKGEFHATISIKDWKNDPDHIIRCFSIVLWDWNKRGLTSNCKKLVEESLHQTFYYNDDSNEYVPIQRPVFVNDPHYPFWNIDTPDIQYTMWIESQTDREGRLMKDVFLTIQFLGDVKPTNIVNHIEFLRSESSRILLEMNKKQFVLVSTEAGRNDSSESKEKSGLNFMMYEFHTTSQFSNFFCEEASFVKKDLDYFLGSKQDYERLGKPWTYTLLNEGPPGVGKTKLVKAIAKMTGYTLIVINLSHITSSQVLYESFHTLVIGGENIPHDKRLYYIPEVDTQICDVLNAREKQTVGAKGRKGGKERKEGKEKKREELSKLQNDILLRELGETMMTVEKKKQPKITLGEILNVLDGVPERYGHILVLDTNCLKTLDPALVRPGRIDRILSWKR